MVLRWAASAFLIAEKNFRKIQDYRDLWMLKAVWHPTLEEKQVNSTGHRIHHTVADLQR